MFNIRLIYIYAILYLIFSATFMSILVILSKGESINENINIGILILIFILLCFVLFNIYFK